MMKKTKKSKGKIYFSPGPEDSFQAHAAFGDLFRDRFKKMSAMKDKNPQMTWDEIENKLVNSGQIGGLF